MEAAATFVKADFRATESIIDRVCWQLAYVQPFFKACTHDNDGEEFNTMLLALIFPFPFTFVMRE